MHKVPVLNFRDFIAADGDQLSTDSHKMAAVFGKRHKNVMQSIERLVGQLPAHHRLNFQPMVVAVEIGSRAVRHDPAYRITRDGFALLAMGFTGKKALAFKLAYIDAFNRMDSYIRNQREGLQYRFLAAELEFKQEKQKVSVCAREMRKWQDTKPAMLDEMSALHIQMQPSLLLN